MKFSYTDIILDHLRKRPDQWFISHELSQVTLDKGWVGTSGIRRAFDLGEAGLLEKEKIGNEVKYRYKPQEKIIERIIIEEINGQRVARIINETITV